MKPERQLLLEQATACRQLALISEARAAERLRVLATEYETQALADTAMKGTVVTPTIQRPLA